MFGLNDVLQRKGAVLNSFIGRDMQDCLLLAKRKFGGAKIHYTGIYNTHAIDPMYAHKVYRVNDLYRMAVKGVVNCQNTLDNVVPRMQQWPLDIPQLHITPHPQVSAKIIILYAFHTHRRIKSKLPSHINSIYLSDINEEMIQHFSHVGSVLWHKRLCYRGYLETVDLQHIDSRSFPSQNGTLSKYWFNVGQRRRSWSNIKTALDQFLVGKLYCNQFSADIIAVKVYSIG